MVSPQRTTQNTIKPVDQCSHPTTNQLTGTRRSNAAAVLWCYRPFLVSGAVQILSEDFGLFTWPSGVVLAYLIWTRRREFRGVSVVEIGAGTALPGLLAAKVREARGPLSEPAPFWLRDVFQGPCALRLVLQQYSWYFCRASWRTVRGIHPLLSYQATEVINWFYCSLVVVSAIGSLGENAPPLSTTCRYVLFKYAFGCDVQVFMCALVGVNAFLYRCRKANLRHPSLPDTGVLLHLVSVALIFPRNLVLFAA